MRLNPGTKRHETGSPGGDVAWSKLAPEIGVSSLRIIRSVRFKRCISCRGGPSALCGRGSRNRNAALLWVLVGSSRSRERNQINNVHIIRNRTMRINLQHLNLRSRDRLDRWVEEQIFALGETRQIDEANVRLECRSHSSPTFASRTVKCEFIFVFHG
jgi:hypothetical protein